MKIYVVEGSTGEYSDHREWLVKAFVNEECAQDFVERVGREYRRLEQECEGDRWNIGDNSLDPYMQTDYTGTNYRYFEVELDEEE